MIRFCACIKRFVIPSKISEGQESSYSCRSCGGILSVDEIGVLSRRMWSATGSELSQVIDPQLKWKIPSNCKQRALRRARTFKRDNGKKSAAKDLKDIEDLFDKASKREGDMLVSESEKFGVSLLGRRFSDNLESFPIKKRIISLLPSLSTPHFFSSSGFHDHKQASHCASFQNNQVSCIHDELIINHSHGVELDHEKCSADEKRSLAYIDEHMGDSADFSGISILAAAACHSSIEKGLTNAEGPTARESSFEKNLNSLTCIESPRSKDQPCSPELGNDKPEQPAVHLITVNALGEEPEPMESDEYKAEHSGSWDSSPSKKKLESSRDDRLHWDLNTIMDVWESHSDDYSKCDQHCNVKCSPSHAMVCGNQGPHQDRARIGIKEAELVALSNEYSSYSSSKLEEVDRKHASVADCDGGRRSFSQTQVCESMQGKYQFGDAEVMTTILPERTNPDGNGENCSLITASACLFEGATDLASGLSAKMADLQKEDMGENNSVRFSMEVNTHNALFYPAIIGNTSSNMHAFETSNEDKKGGAMLHEESRSITTIDICNGYSGECHPSYGGMRSSHVDKHHSLSTDVVINPIRQKSPADLQLDHNTNVMAIGGDEKTFQSSYKSMIAEVCLSDETAYADDFGSTYVNGNHSTVILLNSGEKSNELSLSRIACISQYEDTAADVKVDGSRSSIVTCDSLSANKSDLHFHTNLGLVNSISEGINPDTKGFPALLTSYGESRTSAGVHVESSEKDSVQEHFDYEHHLNASPIDTDHATGLEKVDFLGDDDSQYEDGELRGSVLNSWEDGAEEVETERVDYGSDCRDVDSFEAESDFCSQSDLAVGTTECKHEGRLISTCDGDRSRLTEDSQSKCSQAQFSMRDFSGEGDARVDMLKDSGKVLDVNVASEVPAIVKNRFTTSNLPTGEGDVSWKASQPTLRMKSSGWDKLPRSEDAEVSHWNIDDSSVASSVNGESARKRIVTSIKRDLSSRVEVSKSSEASCRKEASYERENRKHNDIDLNAERSADASRLHGRSRAFLPHGRGRVWMDPPDHHGSCRIDISSYYSSPKFPHPVSRNAAAVAVAKVESNGFVVAPDGTIVKGGSLGPGSYLSGHSSKSSAQFHSTRRGSPIESDGEFCMSSELSNSREVSPGKCFNAGRGKPTRHGSRLFSLTHGKRHHAPIPDSRVSSQPLLHPSSRRQRSFSPHRRPILLSHELTRSPSRSRTRSRSPHTWTSPRGRNDGRLSGIPDMKRQSRSPTNFKPQRRILRQRSPPHHGGPADEFVGYAPPSRNHSPPPHASRWFDNDRIFRGHLREHQPRRPRGRSPPTRIFSQSNRIDDMDSRGRMKPDEYYEPIYSGRFQEYAGYGRGSKHDDCGDERRERSNRYGILHRGGNMRSSGSTNCLHYDDEIRSHNLRPKSLVFQRRQSPRSFDRSIDAQDDDSPRRIKGEMVHFRHGRDAKSNTDFKPFKVRNTSDDNMCLQRRPS